MARWKSWVAVLAGGLGVGCAPARGPAAGSGVPAATTTATTTVVEVDDAPGPVAAGRADVRAARRAPLAGRWIRTGDGWVWRSEPLDDGRWVELEMPQGDGSTRGRSRVDPSPGEGDDLEGADAPGADVGNGDDPRLPPPAERPGALRLASPRPSAR